MNTTNTTTTPASAFTQMRDKRRHNDNDDEFTTTTTKRTKLSTTTKSNHTKRIQQRLKMIQFGKNTLGYTNYLKQVPRHKRKKFSMKCPATPDVYDDQISTRRFQGQVKAWRKALHAYDPLDCMLLPLPDGNGNKSSVVVDDADTMGLVNAIGLLTSSCVSNSNDNIQAEQMKEAVQKGLQVDFHSTAATSVDADDAAASGVVHDDDDDDHTTHNNIMKHCHHGISSSTSGRDDERLRTLFDCASNSYSNSTGNNANLSDSLEIDLDVTCDSDDDLL